MGTSSAEHSLGFQMYRKRGFQDQLGRVVLLLRMFGGRRLRFLCSQLNSVLCFCVGGCGLNVLEKWFGLANSL